jgi:magnesium transporter
MPPRDPVQYLLVEPERCSQAAAAPEALPARGFIWVDCHYGARRSWVEPVEALTGVRIFENHLLDAENPAHPSYFESTQRYEMIVFRGLSRHQPSAGSNEPIRIRTHPTVFFLFPRVLVTLTDDAELVSSVQQRMLDRGDFNHRLPARPEELMLRLLNGMVDRYLALRQPLTAQIDRSQRELLDPRRPFRDWSALLDARREVRKLENLSEEQLDALQEWRDERLDRRGDVADRHEPSTEAPGDEPAASLRSPMTDAMEVRVNDLVQHIDRVLRHARRLESSVETAVQLHFSATAHRTNEIIRVLTVLTAIFMPLTLITGIFGMNFEFIPGLHSSYGFWGTLAGMVLLAIALLAFFRARRYLSSSGARRTRSKRKPAAPAPDAAGQPPAPGAGTDSASTQPM